MIDLVKLLSTIDDDSKLQNRSGFKYLNWKPLLKIKIKLSPEL